MEGEGDVAALPVLLRRIAGDLGIWNLDVPTPYRIPRTRLAGRAFEDVVHAQALRAGQNGAVLVLLDADDDCPAELGTKLLRQAQAARPDINVSVVLANREFESWFVAAAHSLAGHHGLPSPLVAPTDPEAGRDAKGWLSAHMVGRSYKATVDQARFAARFDMDVARQNSRSFAKFYRDVKWLLTA